MKDIALIQSTTAAVDVTSVAYDLGDLSTFSVSVDFSGGAGNLAGTLYLQASNDGSDFVNVVNSDQAITSSASHVWNVVGAAYRYVRAFWDFTSGTGNITARLIAKETIVRGGS